MSLARTHKATSSLDHLVAAALLPVIVYIYCFSVHYKTIRPFPPSLSLSLFPCCLCCCYWCCCWCCCYTQTQWRSLGGASRKVFFLSASRRFTVCTTQSEQRVK